MCHVERSLSVIFVCHLFSFRFFIVLFWIVTVVWRKKNEIDWWANEIKYVSLVNILFSQSIITHRIIFLKVYKNKQGFILKLLYQLKITASVDNAYNIIKVFMHLNSCFLFERFYFRLWYYIKREQIASSKIYGVIFRLLIKRLLNKLCE